MNFTECLRAYFSFFQNAEFTQGDALPTQEQCERYLADYKEDFYTRKAPVHATASAFVMNRDLTKVLFAYHKIYDSYAWLGGHADGETDLLAVALREAKEESSLAEVLPYSHIPVSVRLLPVRSHVKRGEQVPEHFHLDVCFCLIAEESSKIAPKTDENTSVAWLNAEKLSDYVKEKNMLPVYAGCIAAIRRIEAKKRESLPLLPSLLLPWFTENKRDLPWRHTADAYRVWVSEIMLQQTRVEAVKKYYERFLARLPSVFDLAACEEDELLKLWEGLGYYNRVRNMQKAAKLVVEKYNGQFPSEAAELKKLPGIGEYTAGAVASIAFGKPSPAVDGNVIRVLSRYLEDYRSSEELKTALQAPLAKIYPEGECSAFTQSLMELGALVCTPDSPDCSRCPLQAECLAYRSNAEDELPIIPQKKPRKTYDLNVFLMITPQGIGIRKRKEKGVLFGLWEFPNMPDENPSASAPEVLANLKLHVKGAISERRHTHIFTHLVWNMRAFLFDTDDITPNVFPNLTYLPLSEIEAKISVPSAFRWCLQDLQKFYN